MTILITYYVTVLIIAVDAQISTSTNFEWAILLYPFYLPFQIIKNIFK